MKSPRRRNAAQLRSRAGGAEKFRLVRIRKRYAVKRIAEILADPFGEIMKIDNGFAYPGPPKHFDVVAQNRLTADSIIGFGRSSVSGRSRSPYPAANTNARNARGPFDKVRQSPYVER